MQRTLLTTIALMLLLGGPAWGAGASARAKPSLKITKMSPLTLAGRHFRAHERVTVKVFSSSGTSLRRTRTTAAGSFGVAFDGVVVERCGDGFSVVAVGARGDRASIKEKPPEDCPPPL
jgi:hypothetical protein